MIEAIRILIECIKIFLNVFTWIYKFFFRHRQYKLDKKLLSCCRERNLDGAEEALVKGADVNACDVDGRTPLIIASTLYSTLHSTHKPSSTDSFNLVKLLFREGLKRQGEKRIQVNAFDNKRNTALIMAARNGAKDIVEELCKLRELNPPVDIDINWKNRRGYTALMRAEKHGYTETARILRKYGAR